MSRPRGAVVDTAAREPQRRRDRTAEPARRRRRRAAARRVRCSLAAGAGATPLQAAGHGRPALGGRRRWPPAGAGARGGRWSLATVLVGQASWAGTTTSSTGSATPPRPPAASRSPTGWLDPGTRLVRARVRGAARWCRSRSPTASPPASPTWSRGGRPARQRRRCAAAAVLVAAVGGVVRALPRLPVVRRLGRPGRGRARPRSSMTVLAALLGVGVHFLLRAAGPGRRQRGRLPAPAAAARAADRGAPAAVALASRDACSLAGRWSSPAAGRAAPVAGRALAVEPSVAARLWLAHPVDREGLRPCTVGLAPLRDLGSLAAARSSSPSPALLVRLRLRHRPALHLGHGRQRPGRRRRRARRLVVVEPRTAPAPSSRRFANNTRRGQSSCRVARLRRPRATVEVDAFDPIEIAARRPGQPRRRGAGHRGDRRLRGRRLRPADVQLRQRRDASAWTSRWCRLRRVRGPRQLRRRASGEVAMRAEADRPSRARDDLHAGPAPPRRERVERQEPLHRLGRRRPDRQGPRRGRARRRADARGRAAAPTSCTPRCSAARSTPPTWPSTPPTGTGSRCAAPGGSTSATTARCRARTRSRRSRSTARSSSCSGAAPSTYRRRRSTTTTSSPRSGDPQYADLGDEMPRTECLKDVIARFLPYWESDDRARPAGRPDRARRRPRQQPARAGQAPRRHQRRRHRRPQHPDRHAAGLRARRRRCADRRRAARYLDPEAAAEAAAAVANQGR